MPDPGSPWERENPNDGFGYLSEAQMAAIAFLRRRDLADKGSLASDTITLADAISALVTYSATTRPSSPEAVLREALEPFAREAALYAEHVPDDLVPTIHCLETDTESLAAYTVGDLRKARAAVADLPRPTEGEQFRDVAKALYDAADTMSGIIDEETYDEIKSQDYDPPLDCVFTVNLTFAQVRAFDKAINAAGAALERAAQTEGDQAGG